MTATPWPPWPPPAARQRRQALKLIKVDYEVLPHVTDVDEAMKPSAPVINSKLFTEGLDETPRECPPTLRRASSSAMATWKPA